jgi:hypothetical protein
MLTHTAHDQSRRGNWIFWLVVLAPSGGLLFLIGSVYSIVHPQRGLQDLLAGTWLAPR